jgi:hypothetical protein
MKHYELLRQCADRLEKQAVGMGSTLEPGVVLVYPRHLGRFPFAGGKTEMLNQMQHQTAYWVPVSRILTALGKALKEQYP